MNTYDFIFSNRLGHRLYRHSIFWCVFLAYFYFVNFLPATPSDLLNSKTYLDAFELMIYAPISVISVYIAIYYLLPFYILRGKYAGLLVIITGLTLFYFSLAWVLTFLLANLDRNIPFHQLPVSFRWFQPIRYGIGLPLTSAVLTTIIKLMKSWQLEQKENELLHLQKIKAELRLLKSQFQPLFLYDALQHIYLLIIKRSPQAPGTLLNLSELLSYILYENEKEQVALKNELEIVRIYLELKKTFYPERLKIQLDQQVETADVYIAPLLLVSLVENCLEKFLQTSEPLLTLNLAIKTEKKDLYFQLECESSYEMEGKKSNADYDWNNLVRRIEMQYPGRHSFDISVENKTTFLLLILELDGIDSGSKQEQEEFAAT